MNLRTYTYKYNLNVNSRYDMFRKLKWTFGYHPRIFYNGRWGHNEVEEWTAYNNQNNKLLRVYAWRY
jgi:hypothetical protein